MNNDENCYLGCEKCDGCSYLDSEESPDRTTNYPVCKKYKNIRHVDVPYYKIPYDWV